MSFEAGERGERFVGSILHSAGITFKKNPAELVKDLKLWDLEIRVGRRLRLEVKFDRMEAKTGNVAVEYWNTRSDTPSGILATRADVWIFVLDGPMTAWGCPVSSLRNYFTTQPCERVIVRGGDGNSAMRLYRRSELFAELFTRLDTLTTEGLRQFFSELPRPLY